MSEQEHTGSAAGPASDANADKASAMNPDGAYSLAATPAAVAGAMLRAAREAQGLHIAALAAAIKVTPRKLEALEAGRHDELPDATFTRALAQTVARSLKIDPRPILEQLPPAGPQPLGAVEAGLNQPFREGAPRSIAPGAPEPGFSGWRPMLWGAAALLVAAVLLYFVPLDELTGLGQGAPATPAASGEPSAPAPAASDAAPSADPADPAPSAPVPLQSPTSAASGPLVETVFSAPRGAALAEAQAPTPEPPPAGVLVLSTAEPSWVEVVDARGTTLLSRTLMPGERLGLDGALPLSVVVGNVEATELVFRGRPVDLSARGRDNVARLQLR